MSTYITVKELCRKYNFNRTRLSRWIKKGWVQAKMVEKTVEHRGRSEKMIKQKVKMFMINEDQFLEIPAFVRNGRMPH